MISYPDKAGLGQEFNISLCLFDFENENYDVKIYLPNGKGSYSRIKDGNNFKSGVYYINDAITNIEPKEFTILVNEYVVFVGLVFRTVGDVESCAAVVRTR